MMASDRLLEIEEKYGSVVERIVPVELDGEMLRVVLYLKDSSNLRITELWADKILKKYSYYWLNTDNELKIGWDNAHIIQKLRVSRTTDILVSKRICSLPLKIVWRT